MMLLPVGQPPKGRSGPDGPDLGISGSDPPEDADGDDGERAERAQQDPRVGRDAGLGDVERLLLDRLDPPLGPLVLLRQHDETGQQEQQAGAGQHERGDADDDEHQPTMSDPGLAASVSALPSVARGSAAEPEPASAPSRRIACTGLPTSRARSSSDTVSVEVGVRQDECTTPSRRVTMRPEDLSMTRYVFDFSEGSASQKDLLGGKGANLAEMTNLGLPVPPGFTITHRCLPRLPGDAATCPPSSAARSTSTSPRSRRRWAARSARPTTRCWCRCGPARSSRCPG